MLVQHHHAHIAAVMAEHGRPAGEVVIGCAFDGTGYGTDGAIWGGEILIAGYDGFERAAHLQLRPAAGRRRDHSKAVPVGAVPPLGGGDRLGNGSPAGAVRAAGERTVLRRQLERGVGCVPTSSMGRLFDAVSSLLGLRHTVSYEAQAAIELEAAAEASLGVGTHVPPSRHRWQDRSGADAARDRL